MSKPPTFRQASLYLIYVFFVASLVEIGSRAYLSISEEGNFFHPETILYKYYPLLGKLKPVSINHDDGYVDILFLGGSVINDLFGEVRKTLMVKLSKKTSRKMRIFSLANAAHTSLDSLYKYRNLADKQFDLVFVYHSINELRFNNSPDDAFQIDYSHSAWYRQINLIEDHQELKYIAFPYVIALGLNRLRDTLDPPELLPPDMPEGDWLRYGSSVKSAASLRANLQEIIDISIEKGEPILLATFAFHVPADYSLDRFNEKTLDYGQHLSPIEIWGDALNVIAGLRVHNDVINDVARESNVMLIDMERIIPKSGDNFNDICHLTVAGSDKFAEAVLPFVLQAMSSDKNGHVE